MIRVLTVIGDLHYGGGESRILQIARAVDGKRFDHRVLTIYKPDPDCDRDFGPMRDDFERAGIELINLGIERTRSSIPQPLRTAQTANIVRTAIQELRSFLVSEQIDLVDAHIDSGTLVGLPAAHFAGVPSVVTLYATRPFKLFAFSSQIHRWAIRRTAAVITDSRATAQALRTFAGLSADHVRVIPNGLRLDPPSRTRADVLAEWNIPETATVIGKLGGYVPFKGHRVLLDAAQTFLARFPRAYLVCVGFARTDPEYPKILEEHARKLGIADRVRLTSYSGNIADVWNAIDLHVHASLMESLPNAIIEGMSLGKPAVVTEVGGIPDLVEHGRTGLVVKPDDAAALNTAVSWLLEDRSYAARLGRAAHARYLETCTPEVVTRQVEECWTECAGAVESEIHSPVRAASA